MALSESFVVDFQRAQQDTKPAGILNIEWGDYDGQFKLLFALPGTEHRPFNIVAAVQNLTDYPNNHEYVIFCEDDPPPYIEDVLQSFCGTGQKTVSEFISTLSNALSGLHLNRYEDSVRRIASKGETQSFNKEDSLGTTAYRDDPQLVSKENSVSATPCEMLEEVASHEAFSNTMASGDSPHPVNAKDSLGATAYGESHYTVGDKHSVIRTIDDGHSDLSSDLESLVSDDDCLSSAECRDRLDADLHQAEKAGFSVGYMGHLTDSSDDAYGFVTVSYPMAKLGISEEVMQAWEVDLFEHLMLIIHYPKGYKTHEELQGSDGQGYDRSNIGMRVVAGKYEMPTLLEAENAFMKDKTEDHNIHGVKTVRDIFISKQLSTLLEESLVPILRFRNVGLDWHGAESWFSDFQGMDESLDPNAVPDIYFEPETNSKIFPDIVTADHFTSHNGPNYSFPLLAMQFVLRHFVRCTEFCLTCHRKLNLDFEALKPYYCERPLCLFQYLNSGWVEHEIVTQPYVVDLLISFCYNSARWYKLKEYPDDLALKVPIVRSEMEKSLNANVSMFQPPDYNVSFDCNNRVINFVEVPREGCPVKKDAWIVISCSETEFHCRVSDTSRFPVIFFDEPVFLRGKKTVMNDLTTQQLNSSSPKMPIWMRGTLTPYNVDFDMLNNDDKCDVICHLLDTLPTVKEMQTYLADHHPGDLKCWIERLSPAALRLLRWIVATNRACIMQVDGDTLVSTKRQWGSIVRQERLFGMKGYMQFRFAMGAPDKEQRFLNEVRKTTERLNLKYPTIFAWHGSPLFNWHMIIREGLNYDSVNRGRAFGDGVYNATDAFTSECYSGAYINPLNAAHISPSSSHFLANRNSSSSAFLGNALNLFSSSSNFSAASPITPSPVSPNTASPNSAGTVSDTSSTSTNDVNMASSSSSIPGSLANYSANRPTALSVIKNARAQGFFSHPLFFWPNSVLNISSALALNEIVNAPKEFVSSDPYYVVSQLDWIQTRYLLVKCNPVEGVHIGLEIKPSNPYPQDPSRIPKGVSGPIIIPASAIKSDRGIMTKETKSFESTPGKFTITRRALDTGFASSSGSCTEAKKQKGPGETSKETKKLKD